MTPTDLAIQAALFAATEAEHGIEVRTSSAKSWCRRAYAIRTALRKEANTCFDALRLILSPGDPNHTIWVVNTAKSEEPASAKD